MKLIETLFNKYSSIKTNLTSMEPMIFGAALNENHKERMGKEISDV